MSKKKLFNIPLESEEDIQDQITVSNEELASTMLLLGWMAAGLGAMSVSSWLEKRSSKKPKETETTKKLNQSLENLKNTLLNDNWLSKQTYKNGKVNIPNSEMLLINFKLPIDPLEAISNSINTILSLDNKISSEYEKFTKAVIDISKPIEDVWESLTKRKFDALTDKDKKDLITLQENIDKKLSNVKHPVTVYWKNIPDHRTIIGQLIKIYNGEGSFGEEPMYSVPVSYEIDKLNKPKNIQLSSLDKNGVKKAGEILKRLYEVELNRVNSKQTLFQKSIDLVFSLPIPQDGWPYKDIPGLYKDDVFPELALDTLGDIGHLSEQISDPIFMLNDTYTEVLSNVQKLLINWINASVKNSGVSNEGFKDWVKDLFVDTFNNDKFKELNNKLSELKDIEKNIGNKKLFLPDYKVLNEELILLFFKYDHNVKSFTTELEKDSEDILLFKDIFLSLNNIFKNIKLDTPKETSKKLITSHFDTKLMARLDTLNLLNGISVTTYGKNKTYLQNPSIDDFFDRGSVAYIEDNLKYTNTTMKNSGETFKKIFEDNIANINKNGLSRSLNKLNKSLELVFNQVSELMSSINYLSKSQSNEVRGLIRNTHNLLLIFTHIVKHYNKSFNELSKLAAKTTEVRFKK